MQPSNTNQSLSRLQGVDAGSTAADAVPPSSTRQTLWDWLGWCGAVALVTAYALFSFSLLEAKMMYHLVNLLGAVGVGKAAWSRKSYPAAFVEFAWAAIASVALYRFCRGEM